MPRNRNSPKKYLAAARKLYAQKGSFTFDELAEEVGVFSKGTVSHAVKRLVAEGSLHRIPYGKIGIYVPVDASLEEFRDELRRRDADGTLPEWLQKYRGAFQ